MRRRGARTAGRPGGAHAADSRYVPPATGSVTVNVLPLPCPALSAVTVPPCISTSPLTSASPMPRPPVERSMLRSTWENMSKMLAETRRDADPVVADGHDDFRRPAARRRARCAAALGVLGAVGEQVAEHLGQPGQVGVEEDRLRRQRDGQLVPGGLDERAGRLHGAAHDVREQHAATGGAPSCCG